MPGTRPNSGNASGPSMPSCGAIAGCWAANGTTIAPLPDKLPTAEMIDKYVGERPVFLRRYDGHMGVVNSRVLQLAGITDETPDPSGGIIYRKPGSRNPAAFSATMPCRSLNATFPRRPKRKSSTRSAPPSPKRGKWVSPVCRIWTAATPSAAADSSVSISS